MVSKNADLVASRAGSLSLVGGALALDFANTASGRGGPQAQDHLRAPEHLFGWAEHVDIIDRATAGFLLGFNRFAGEVFEPVLVAVYSIPKITL